MRKVWQMESFVIPSFFVFSDLLTLGASLTCACIPICAAISLQYICVSSRLMQEHEKWRRARSSVPRIGAVHETVCACVCVCLFVSVSLYFHQFSSLLERWHDESSHRSGESVAVPHLPPLLTLPDDMGLIAASAGPVSPSPLFEDYRMLPHQL